jgi:hypothetical protein
MLYVNVACYCNPILPLNNDETGSWEPAFPPKPRSWSKNNEIAAPARRKHQAAEAKGKSGSCPLYTIKPTDPHLHLVYGEHLASDGGDLAAWRLLLLALMSA